MGLSHAPADDARHPDRRARVPTDRPVAGARATGDQTDTPHGVALVVRVISVAGPPMASIEEEAAAYDTRRARNGPAPRPSALIDAAVRQLAAHRSNYQRATRRSVPFASNSTIPSATPRSSTRGHSSAKRPRSSVRSARIARSRAR